MYLKNPRGKKNARKDYNIADERENGRKKV